MNDDGPSVLAMVGVVAVVVALVILVFFAAGYGFRQAVPVRAPAGKNATSVCERTRVARKLPVSHISAGVGTKLGRSCPRACAEPLLEHTDAYPRLLRNQQQRPESGD